MAWPRPAEAAAPYPANASSACVGWTGRGCGGSPAGPTSGRTSPWTATRSSPDGATAGAIGAPRPRQNPRSGLRASAGRPRRRRSPISGPTGQSALGALALAEAAGPAQGRQSDLRLHQGLADDRDRTRLFRMPLDGSSFTSVSASVIRKSVEGLQVVGAVHHKPLPGATSSCCWPGMAACKVRSCMSASPKTRPSGQRELGRDAGHIRGSGSGSAAATARATRSGREPQCATASSPRANGRTVVPVFRDPRGAGKHVMISRCPSLPGFVLAKTQNWLELGLFYGPTALGPWTTLFYGPFVPPGAAPDPRDLHRAAGDQVELQPRRVGDVERRAAADRLQRSRRAATMTPFT